MEYATIIAERHAEAQPLRGLVIMQAERDRILTADQVHAIGSLCAQLELQAFPIGTPLEVPIDAFEDRSEVLRPYAITQDDFREFARLSDGRYTNRAACGAWTRVLYTQHAEERTPTNAENPLPKLAYLTADDRILDLRSVHRRLVRTNGSPEAWRNGTKATIGFLSAICDAHLDQPREDQ